jgi:hypothetical protein
VSATPGLAHEGNGGPGAPVTLSASVNAVASTFVSPFSRRPLIPLNPVPGAGLPVTWLPDPGHQTQALGQPCSASWSASQLVEVVGEAAPYALNGDFYFRFMPVTQPSGSMGSGKCPPSVGSYEGVDYAPYNDYSISAAAEKQGLVIILPQKPGGTRDYPIKLPGVVDATWHVTIEFLEPSKRRDLRTRLAGSDADQSGGTLRRV